MNSIDNFQKTFVISVVSVAKPKNIIIFALTYVLEVLPCFIAISAWISNSVDSDEAMKQGDEALNASSL
jgi:hypothetical protein